MADIVQCPACGASYRVRKPDIGKMALCRRCGNKFTMSLPSRTELPQGPETQAKQRDGESCAAEVTRGPASTSAPTTANKKPKAPSFWDKIKDFAESVQRQANVVYVQGPWAIRSKTTVTMILEDSRILVRAGLINKQEFSISYELLTGISVETAERLGKLRTIGSWALAGPVAGAIVGFGLKKKDRFLKLDFLDDTNTGVCAIFAKAAGTDIATLQGRISQAKHDYLATRGTSDNSSGNRSGRQSGSDADVASLITKLAQLRKQGILSKEEYEHKKAELLSRM